MGLGKSFICADCGNTFEMYEGIGMLWYSFDTSMFYPNSDLSESEMDSLSQAVQTKIKKANQIKKALSNLSNIEVF